MSSYVAVKLLQNIVSLENLVWVAVVVFPSMKLTGAGMWTSFLILVATKGLIHLFLQSLFLAKVLAQLYALFWRQRELLADLCMAIVFLYK